MKTMSIREGGGHNSNANMPSEENCEILWGKNGINAVS